MLTHVALPNLRLRYRNRGIRKPRSQSRKRPNNPPLPCFAVYGVCESPAEDKRCEGWVRNVAEVDGY